MGNFLKIFLIIIGVALFTQASIYIYVNKKSAAELIYSSAGSGSDVTTVKISDIQSGRLANTQDSFAQVPKYKLCDFDTGLESSRGPVIFSQINWMGSEDNVNDEWIELKLISDSADISGWQIINKSGRLHAIIPPKTSLISYRPNYSLKRGVNYSGALKNTDEGLRLFDADCNLIDEVFADQQWPAGDNNKKLVMKRAGDLSWYDNGNIESQTPTLNKIQNTNDQIIEPVKLSKEAKTETETETTTFNSQPQQELIPINYQKNQMIVGQQDLDIKIYEIRAGSESGSDDEYVALYNYSNTPANLDGWQLTKKTKSGNEYNLVSKSKFKGVISGKSAFVIAHKDYQGGRKPDLFYSNNSNPLAYSENDVVLYDQNGKIVDQVFYGKLEKGEVWAK